MCLVTLLIATYFAITHCHSHSSLVFEIIIVFVENKKTFVRKRKNRELAIQFECRPCSILIVNKAKNNILYPTRKQLNICKDQTAT